MRRPCAPSVSPMCVGCSGRRRPLQGDAIGSVSYITSELGNNLRFNFKHIRGLLGCGLPNWRRRGMKGPYRFCSPMARLAICFGSTGILASPTIADAPEQFLPEQVTSSTIPGNGDLNPYGVAIVPPGFPSNGAIRPGDILVSNFNNSSNLQGTGTTIIK